MLTRLLYGLDRSSARFPEQLSELLQDVGWVKEFQYLPEGDLVKLIGYLDNVRSISTAAKPCSPHPYRFLTISIARARRSKRAFIYYGKFAARGQFSPRRTKPPAILHSIPGIWSLLANPAAPTKFTSAEQMFASNDLTPIPRKIRRRLNRYLIFVILVG